MAAPFDSIYILEYVSPKRGRDAIVGIYADHLEALHHAYDWAFKLAVQPASVGGGTTERQPPVYMADYGNPADKHICDLVTNGIDWWFVHGMTIDNYPVSA